jgi:hypothetical protein
VRLADYLAAPRPAWDWIALDCCRWVDAWVQARGHGSPIAALGLVYDSERSALRRIAEAGGLVPLWTAGMALVGVPEVDDPVTGSVGIIARPTVCGTGEAAAIFTGDRWVSLGPRGLDFAPADALRVWRV